MLKVYRQLYDILDRRERRLTLAVFAMMVFVALFEAVGVASIMPVRLECAKTGFRPLEAPKSAHRTSAFRAP
jgi:hypothetical protein